MLPKRLTEILFSLALASLLAGGLAAHNAENHANLAMANAATSFLNSLSEKQRAKTAFDFSAPHRVTWDFLPVATIGRKGVSLLDLDKKQKMFAYDLLESGLSAAGNEKILNIIDLERVLLELEGKDTRIPELYHVMVYGEPSIESNWAWRFEGHHLSLNFTIVDGVMTATAPRFLGANPAEVREGDRKGLRALGKEEDLARELLASFDAKQRKVALFQEVAYSEIVTNRASEVGPLPPVGLKGDKMTDEQRVLLETLILEYASTMERELAEQRMAAIREKGIGKVRFGWAGGTEHGEPHYYRVQGPSFLIEYDNAQNKANHAHSVWRDFDGDFGRDILKEHYLSHGH